MELVVRVQSAMTRKLAAAMLVAACGMALVALVWLWLSDRSPAEWRTIRIGSTRAEVEKALRYGGGPLDDTFSETVFHNPPLISSPYYYFVVLSYHSDKKDMDQRLTDPDAKLVRARTEKVNKIERWFFDSFWSSTRR